MQQYPYEQNAPADKMHHEVPESCPQRSLVLLKPYENSCGNRHHLPENEEGEEVTRKHHAQRTANVEERENMVFIFFYVNRVENNQQPDEGEDISYEEA
ncbi:MAG: hypothetical protein DDT25_01070 [Chloroflexi bacterium]|nr:hypothetical protein [Chloroflexota bacterium]